jgi:hypothetical protein
VNLLPESLKEVISHYFNKGKKRAGKDWLAEYVSKNPELSLRSPETTPLQGLLVSTENKWKHS